MPLPQLLGLADYNPNSLLHTFNPRADLERRWEMDGYCCCRRPAAAAAAASRPHQLPPAIASPFPAPALNDLLQRQARLPGA